MARRRTKGRGWLILIAGPLFAAASCGNLKDPGIASEQGELDTTLGSWDTAPAMAPGEGFIPIHSSLMRTDEILAVGGSSFNTCYTWGRDDVRTFVPGAQGLPGTWSAKKSGPYLNKILQPCEFAPDVGSLVTPDAFCSGHAHDDQGRIVFQGGLRGYDYPMGGCNGTGLGQSARFTPGGSFAAINSTLKHWYPTLVAGVRATYLFPGENRPDNPGNVLYLPYGATTSWRPPRIRPAAA